LKDEVIEYFLSEKFDEENARKLAKRYPTLEEAKAFIDEENRKRNADIQKSLEPKTDNLPPSGGSTTGGGGGTGAGGGDDGTSGGGGTTIIASTRHTNPDENKATEVAAVAFVLEKYPHLEDKNETNPNNAGFDLHDHGQGLYIEVKGISGAFGSVSMTSAQFECALQKRDKFWLYVVEYAQSNSPKLYRLHDPAGFEDLRLAFRNDPTMGWETD